MLIVEVMSLPHYGGFVVFGKEVFDLPHLMRECSWYSIFSIWFKVFFSIQIANFKDDLSQLNLFWCDWFCFKSKEQLQTIPNYFKQHLQLQMISNMFRQVSNKSKLV